MKRMRVFLRGVAAVGIVCTGFGLFCYANNDTKVVVTSYEYESSKYTGSKDFRIVQLSDFHNHSLAYFNGDLLDIIASLNPDMIVLTGDFIDDHTRDYSMIQEMIAAWKSKAIPLFYVDGNHELHAPENAAKEHQIFDTWAVNMNEKRLDLGNGIVLSGVRDPGYRKKGEWPTPFKPYEGDVPAQLNSLAGSFDASKLNIMLCHRPNLFDLIAAKGYDLTFSGHTHGGQIKIGNWAVASAPWEAYVAGAYTKGLSHLYVSRGLGTSYYLPVRYRCTAEIVLTTIKSKA
jgi:uncharacterized protein